MSLILTSALKPLESYLKKEGLVELSAHRAGEVWLEIGRQYLSEQAPDLTFNVWRRLMEVLANMSGQAFHLKNQPRVSSALPGGHRFEGMLGHAVEGHLSISIRLKRKLQLKLEEFGLNSQDQIFLQDACKKGQNIIVSGGTSSGKTTFLNLLASSIPLSKRILSVEDTYELDLPHLHWVKLLVSRNETGQAVGYPQVIEHILRARPDIVMAGEVSIANAYPVLSLLNTGHKGFLCTIHANNARLALEEAFDSKLRLAGLLLPSTFDYLKKTIDIVVHIEKNLQGKRQVKEIWKVEHEQEISLLKRAIILFAVCLSLKTSLATPLKVCQGAITQVSREESIPVKILEAMARAESGMTRYKIPWAWTLRTPKGSFYFKDQKTAQGYFEKALKDSGNIDIGCLQVNWRWHQHNFKDKSQALEPLTNIRIAARFLRSLQQKYGSWIKAIKAYHSLNPQRADSYLKKVLKSCSLKRKVQTLSVQLEKASFLKRQKNMSGIKDM